MILGYNTNGLAYHEPLEALQLLSDTGFKSVAITIDHQWLSPKSESRFDQLNSVKTFLDQNEFHNVIDSRGRYILDPHRKYWPSLLDPVDANVEKRIEFLKYCVDTAVFLNSTCVTVRSGTKPQEHSFQHSLDRLAEGLRVVLDFAEERGVDIGFEPEPGMLIDTTGRFERLVHLVDSHRLKMTMDMSHLFCLSELPIGEYIERWHERIVNVHISDIRAGAHEHLMFGEGQIHFPPVVETLLEVGYQGGMHVELAQHSHNAAEVVHDCFKFLSPIVADAKSAMGN